MQDKIMTATDPADVATLAVIEAMRAISDGQKHVVRTLENIHEEQRDDRKLMLDMRDRLVRIESNQVDRRVARLEETMEEIVEAHQQERGAKNTIVAVWRHTPTALGYIVSIIAVVALFLKASGRI